MGRKNFLSLRMVMFLSVICLIGSVYSFATSSGNDYKPVADEALSSSGISFLPKISYEQIVLTVSRPDGTVFSKTFDNGSVPYLDLSSIYGDNTCDGSYTYELRVTTVAPKKTRDDENGKTSFGGTQNELTQTGHFMVKGGGVLSKNFSEGPAVTMDVVHADDVIITGSLCVGFDCLTDGTENFGFDTIKLKENNIRILFDDTSATAGFPANDWRLTANDSSSGGANYFSIDDVTGSKVPFKIVAGARTSSLFVSSTGRVGLGTATPVLNLHIVYGDTPSFRLDQDTTSGWTAQVWDLAGNESNFFVRDVTGGSKLPFRIQPGTPTNTLTLKNTGYVGIGTWSPGYPIELVTATENAALVCTRTGGASNYINATESYANFGSVSNHPLRLVTNSAWKMMLNTDGSITMSNGASLTAGGAWTNASSRVLKENIQSLGTDEAIDTLNNLNPVKYNYKLDKAEKHVGFIAEDAPELVATQDRKGMSPMDVVAVLTKVVQEQQKSIREQQKVISELKEKVSKLENK